MKIPALATLAAILVLIGCAEIAASKARQEAEYARLYYVARDVCLSKDMAETEEDKKKLKEACTRSMYAFCRFATDRYGGVWVVVVSGAGYSKDREGWPIRASDMRHEMMTNRCFPRFRE